MFQTAQGEEWFEGDEREDEDERRGRADATLRGSEAVGCMRDGLYVFTCKFGCHLFI